MAAKGTRRYTAHISLAVTPQMKAAYERAAEHFQTEASVPLRWALDAWLLAQRDEQANDFLGEDFPGEPSDQEPPAAGG